MATYYIDRSIGSNSNSKIAAQNQATPWFSIAFAVTQATSPGDTMLVKNGTYTEGVTMTASGTAGNPITLKNFVDPITGVAHTPVLNFSGTSQSNAHLEIAASGFPSPISYLTIQGLEFVNSAGSTIKYTNGDHLIIRGNYIHDMKPYDEIVFGNGQVSMMGISGSAGGFNNIIDSNWIENVGGPNSWNKADAGHGVYVNGQQLLIINNVIIRANNLGIQIAGYNNLANYPNSSYGTAQYGLIANNTIAYCNGSGLVLWSGGNGLCANMDVYNNIFFQNCKLANRSTLANGFYFLNAGSGFNIKNNISYGSGVSGGYPFMFNNGVGSFTFSGNCPSSAPSTTTTTILPLSCGTNPTFVNAPETDPGNADFHLTSSSNARGFGLNILLTPPVSPIPNFINPALDKDSVSRPASGGWATGAYELAISVLNRFPLPPTNVAVI